MFTTFDAVTKTVGKVAAAAKFAGSDHVAISSTLSAKKGAAPASRPIPMHVAESPEYAGNVAKLLNAVDLDKAGAFDKVKAVKILLREASKLTFKQLLAKDQRSPEMECQLALQLARAIADRDAWVASKVAKDSSALATCFCIGEDGEIQITDHTKLAVIAQNYAHSAIDAEFKEARLVGKSKPRGGRMAALGRLSKLYSPFAKKAISVGTIKQNGTIANAATAAQAFSPPSQSTRRPLGSSWTNMGSGSIGRPSGFQS